MKNSVFRLLKNLSIPAEKTGYEHSGQNMASVARLPSLKH